MDKSFAPSADRNKDSIADALSNELNAGDLVLELGSGTGQHVSHFATCMPDVQWQPTDLADKLDGMTLWIADSGCSNVLPPLSLDVLSTDWPLINVQVCYSANTLHIISWPAVVMLFEGCHKVLEAKGKLCVYGPFSINGEHNSEGNIRFDAMLRGENDLSGIRDLTELDELASNTGFCAGRITEMPANNRLVVWEKI